MVKEWLNLNWAGNNGKSKMRKTSENKVAAELETPPAGCMCAVFQMFNMHYLPFTLQQQQQPSFQTSTNVVLFQDMPPQSHVLKGVEAPRNSLDLVQPPFMEATSSSSNQFLDEYLNIQMGIQIKTSCETKSEDFSSSPSIKTPNLVARLMGLDLLPSQSTSPSLSSSHISTTTSKRLISKHDCSGTFSLPETPRISSSSRRSDVEHHRLSLQLVHNSKDYSNFLEDDLEFITHERCDKDKSKGQILKQVKESVRRRFGLDMTNTIKSKGQIRNNDINVLLENDEIQTKKLPCKENKQFGKRIKVVKEVHHHHQQKKKAVVLEGSECVRKPPQASDDAVRSKIEEPSFLEKKAKKTPLSTDHLVNISFPANQQLDKQGKKQAFFHDSPPTRKKRWSKQISSHQDSYKQNLHHHHPTYQNFQENVNVSKQNHYIIQTIINHMGIEKNNFYSTSYPPQPLHFSLFHFLELFYHNTPDPMCQRKLIFDLVDELLVEIFKPNVKEEHDRKIKGFDLVEILCKKVGSFPLANCQVIEDIDALIYEDFRRSKISGKWDDFEEGEGGEGMVIDIEDYIVDLLVQETVAIAALMEVDMVTHCVRRLY